MSVRESYDRGKLAAITGLGFLAAARPKAAATALVRIGAHYALQLVTDAKAVSRIIGETLLAPEVAEIKASRLSSGIVVISPWIPLFLFGSHLAHSIDDVFGTVSGDNMFGSSDSEASYAIYGTA